MPDVIVIDCNYLYPRFAAAFLIIENGKIAVIEQNTSHATPLILNAIAERGMNPDMVEYLIVTHAHLDHAGGTSSLLAHCPNATVLAHPKAARTLVNPEKLIRSAEQVYGADEFQKLYGKILPIPENRVRVMGDGESLQFGTRILKFIYTLGHASHHFCIYDSGSNSIFTGDSFGLCYPVLQEKGLFIFPSTSPIDFDPVLAKKSLDKIVETGASRLYLTHFGEVTEIEAARLQMLKHLEFHEELLSEATKSSLVGNELKEDCLVKLTHYFSAQLKSRDLDKSVAWPVIEMDVDLNAQGIAFVAQKRR